mmetsp:Transcript_10793/g.23702  ORF Transcript_10793/g.23702 Transcript_10793/m.23702 type:complete len:315 (-) Transcript_10793:270-1214(-)
MREPGNLRDAVPHRINVRVAHRPGEVVDEDPPPRIVVHPRLLQSDALHVRPASRRHQEAFALDPTVPRRHGQEREDVPAPPRQGGDVPDRLPQKKFHSLFFQRRAEETARFRISRGGEETGRPSDHRHPAPEKRERLRHLQGDDAGAQDDRARGKALQVEEGLAGDVRGVEEAGDLRGDVGTSPRGQDELSEAEGLPVHLQGPRARQPAEPLVDVGPGRPGRPVRIRRRDGRPQPPQPSHDRSEIRTHLDLLPRLPRHRHPHLPHGLSHLRHRPRRPQQRLARHAPRDEAVSPRQTARDEGGAGAPSRGLFGRH